MNELRLAPEQPPITGMRVEFDVAFSEITTPPFYPKHMGECQDWGVALLAFPTYRKRILRGWFTRLVMFFLARAAVRGTDVYIRALPLADQEEDE